MATFNDGTVPYGSQVITIGTQTFVAENITTTEPTTVIERRDELGSPAGQVIISNFITGSCVLQLATTSTPLPTIGATFVVVRAGTPASTIAVIISEIGEVLNQTEAKKVNVSFRKKIN